MGKEEGPQQRLFLAATVSHLLYLPQDACTSCGISPSLTFRARYFTQVPLWYLHSLKPQPLARTHR